MPVARPNRPAQPDPREGDGAPGDDAVVQRRPSLPPVNTRGAAASNLKETRIREAEEDRVLIGKAQQGDTAAFRRLVERHQRRAFAIALALVRDENDARELVQDAFLRVHKSLPTFQGGSSFFTWLYRIITNLSIDLHRKPGRQTVDIDDARLDLDESRDSDFPLMARVDGADPHDVVRREEIAARVQTALDALPSYHRGVIVMREIEGLSYEEMASAMGVSKGTIMSRLFHARQKLQKALADCYQEQIGAPAPDSGVPARVEKGERVMSLPHDTMMDLMAYADGELEGDARARIEELVRTSDEARRVLDAMGVLGEVVREGVDARAEAAAVDEIADEVIAKIERGEPTVKGTRIVVPIASAEAPRRRGRVAAVVAVLALAAGAFFVLRGGSSAPVADNTPHEPPPVLQPVAPSPTEASSAPAPVVAEAEEQGVDLEEVSSTKNKVNVFFMPSGVSAGAVASVVVWIDDRHGGK